MNIPNTAEKLRSYVISQGDNSQTHRPPARLYAQQPAITVSYLAGIDVTGITGALADTLQKSEFEPGRSWAVFNEQLVEKALAEQHWPKELAEVLTEQKRFIIDELMDDLFGLCPASWEFVPQLIKTTLHLAATGHVILIGHGATIVTKRMSNVFHVRLTGCLAKRIERVRDLRHLPPKDAAKSVMHEDRERKRYLKAHFGASLDDELLYDLVVNTDRLSRDDAIALIFLAAQSFFSKQKIES